VGEDDSEDSESGIDDERGLKVSITSLPSTNVGGLCSMRPSATCQGPLPARVERELEEGEGEGEEKKVSDHIRPTKGMSTTRKEMRGHSPRAMNSTPTTPATRIRFCQRRILIDALKAASPSTSRTSISSADVEPRTRASRSCGSGQQHRK
jgi:hypothetical protein